MVLSAIIISAMLRLIDYHVVLHPWQVDKVDFCFCIGAYLGVVFGSVKIGLVVAVSISALRALLFITRLRTTVLSSATSQLHGLPEDGPVCCHIDGARRARAAHRHAHLLRQRQLRAREVSNAGRLINGFELDGGMPRTIWVLPTGVWFDQDLVVERRGGGAHQG